MFEWIM
jgi:hypothetical protein